MKLCRLIIKNYLHLKDIDLDLTYPEGHEKAGEPLEKVCFIGKNGTGKTNLLSLLIGITQNQLLDTDDSAVMAKFKLNSRSIYKASTSAGNSFFETDIEQSNNWVELLAETLPQGFNNFTKYVIPANVIKQGATLENDLLINVPAEGNFDVFKKLHDVPSTTLSHALSEAQNEGHIQDITPQQISRFWGKLIYHINTRRDDLRRFLEAEENQQKTVKEVKATFAADNPHILDGLAVLWNKILNKAGLEFDLAGAKVPIHLNDNLKAYVKVKTTGEQIQYNQLSTGIRNFIFKLGHIYSLYFNKEVNNGFLMVDEPENSLFPDFLYDLVDTYVDIAQNTQIFMATHNPIIAAQFDPAERVILDFDEEVNVVARRGVSPVGDDPNDLLVKDFGVRSLLGEKGLAQWERFIELKQLLAKEADTHKKMELAGEFMKIGQAYNFSGDEAFGKK